MTGYPGKFKVQWWRWYLVDVRDWHKPRIVRKHFENKKQAIKFSRDWLGSEFEPLKGYKAMELNLKDGLNKKPKHRHPTLRANKYDYPPHLKTQKEKQIFRLRLQKKQHVMKHLKPITRKDIFYMLEKKPMGFVIRTKAFSYWHWVYLEPGKNFKYYRRKMKWPNKIRTLLIIEKTLLKFKYDTGPWPLHEVVIAIYDHYKKSLDKFINLNKNPKNENKIKAEFIARGFVGISKVEMLPGKDQCVVKDKDGLNWNLCWPKSARLGMRENAKDKREYIYDLGGLVGIPGYTKCQIPSKYIS